jgi:methionyl-tRNA formyltransferase
LSCLLEADDDDVVVAVCQPDRRRGRGQLSEPPPVKIEALAHHIDVLQPERLKGNHEFLGALLGKELDLAIVVAYGRILPENVFRMPVHGMVNVHASLLPRHRGASPINHAILAGDAETGVSLMMVTQGLDEGPVLATDRFAIEPDLTTGALTHRMAVRGGKFTVNTLRRAKREEIPLEPQDPSRASFAPLLSKSDGALDFRKPAAALARQVRAYDPWPGTFVTLPDGSPLKILGATAGSEVASEARVPGTLWQSGADLMLQTSDGTLVIHTVQPPGKKPMASDAYLRGAGRRFDGAVLPEPC